MATSFGDNARVVSSEAAPVEGCYDQACGLAELKDALKRAVVAAITHRHGECLQQFLQDARRARLEVEIAFQYFGTPRRGTVVAYEVCNGGSPAVRVAAPSDDEEHPLVWTFRLDEMTSVQLCEG